MPQDAKKSTEFRRYRQVLTTLYVATAALGAALLAASVIRELLFHRPRVALAGPSVDPENPDPQELILCNEDVRALLDELNTTSTALMSAPLTGRRIDLGSRWRDFSRDWRDRWDEVNARCGFSEFSGTGLGGAYDRMAQVHSDLPAMRLKYQSLLVKFDDEQAAELVRMERALTKSRIDLTRSIPEGARVPSNAP